MKKLYQLKPLLLFVIILFAIKFNFVNAATCSDELDNFCALPGCPGGSRAGKYHFVIVNRLGATEDYSLSNTKAECETRLKAEACYKAKLQIGNCDPSSWYNSSGWPLSNAQNQAYCNGEVVQVSAITVDGLKAQTNWVNLFSNLLGDDNFTNNWDASKSQLYGLWRCNAGALNPPATVPAPTRCGFPDYSIFSGGLGTSSCTGSSICESTNVIRPGSGTNSDKNFFCIRDRITMCPNAITTYTAAKNSSSGCTIFNPLSTTIPTGSEACKVGTEGRYFKFVPPYREISQNDITSYVNCVKRTSNSNLCFLANFGVPPQRVYRCNCVEQPGLLCTILGVANQPCEPLCTFNQAGFNVQPIQEIKIFSPLQFIKVLSNFLFYAAIFLFIVNFLLAGFDYVRSGGQPDALKTAQAKITNAVGGLVFILLVGALLNYIISILISSGFQA